MIGSNALTAALLAGLLPAVPARSLAPVPLPGGGGGSPDALQIDEEHVDVTLVADTAGVAPGQRFRLGVLLRIDPSWHVYWVNAGEGGFPTRARITGPEGFEVGELRFPAPHRFAMPGDIVAYGFERELLLIADVTAPTELAPGAKLAFGVEAAWLECADVCIPGDASAALELGGIASPDAAPDNERLFARWTARLPRPLAELDGARAHWSGDESAPRLRIELPDGVEPVEFFPYKNERAKLEEQHVGGGALVLAYRFRTTESPDPKAAAGVLRVNGLQGSEAFYELDLAWTSTLETGSGH